MEGWKIFILYFLIKIIIYNINLKLYYLPPSTLNLAPGIFYPPPPFTLHPAPIPPPFRIPGRTVSKVVYFSLNTYKRYLCILLQNIICFFMLHYFNRGHRKIGFSCLFLLDSGNTKGDRSRPFHFLLQHVI